MAAKRKHIDILLKVCRSEGVQNIKRKFSFYDSSWQLHAITFNINTWIVQGWEAGAAWGKKSGAGVA